MTHAPHSHDAHGPTPGGWSPLGYPRRAVEERLRLLAVLDAERAAGLAAANGELAELREALTDARVDAAEHRARADELAKRLRWHEDQQLAIQSDRERASHMLQDADARAIELARRREVEARDAIQQLLDAARDQAARVLDDARSEAHEVAADVERLRQYRSNLRASIRTALGRFEQSLEDLELADAAHAQHVDSLRRSLHAAPPVADAAPVARPPVEVADAVGEAPVPGAAPLIVDDAGPDAAENAEQAPLRSARPDNAPAPVSPPPVSPASRAHGPLVAVQLAISGIDTFVHLGQVEGTIAAIDGVHDVWISSFDDGHAAIEVSVPVDLPLASMLAAVFEARIVERSAHEMVLAFGDEAADDDQVSA